MPQSRTAHYADFALYPVLLAVVISLIADEASLAERALVPAFALGGVLIWTLLEYLLHRFVLHGTMRIAGSHDQHHAWPRAPIQTPTWPSLAAIAIVVSVPALLDTPFILTLGLAGGLMAGFLWYRLVHHAIHHGSRQPLARVISGIARRHLDHHRAEGIGNFGVTTSLWDRIFKSELTVQAVVTKEI
jgi:sterol desaturase/sphingolipid hydroxylase (fatty acid hydroxylase superfamily)